MTETVKERIYRGALETMSDSDFMGNKYVKKFVKGVFKQIEDVPVATDNLSVEKLQEQLNTAKKALTESEEKYQKQMDRFLNSEMNESTRSHCESQLKLLFPAHKAYDALAAIGNEGSGDE